jgi:hypothetical protein
MLAGFGEAIVILLHRGPDVLNNGSIVLKDQLSM